MKRMMLSRRSLFQSALAGTAIPAILRAADPSYTKADRDRILQLLEESEKQFRAAVEPLNDAQWRWKPAPDRWSVAEVAEHIALAEGLLFGSAEKALGAPANPDWEKRTAGKTEFLLKVMPNRDRRAQAPQEVIPQAKLSRAEVMSKFAEMRARTRKFAESTDKPLHQHTAEHPFPVFGTLSAYQWLLYIPLHNIRHNKQIAEVIADPGFPK